MLFSFNLNIQLLVTLQNVNEANREALSPLAASSVYDSTKHNGLVTFIISDSTFSCQSSKLRNPENFFTKLNTSKRWSNTSKNDSSFATKRIVDNADVRTDNTSNCRMTCKIWNRSNNLIPSKRIVTKNYLRLSKMVFIQNTFIGSMHRKWLYGIIRWARTRPIWSGLQIRSRPEDVCCFALIFWSRGSSGGRLNLE